MTIDLHVPEDVPVAPAGTAAPVEGTALDARGEPIGGVRLFVENGRLAALEVYSDDERPAR